MKLSASQLETANEGEQGCLRKWAFQYKLRLPTYKKDHFGFGTCLHGVCERFLIGAKDLYPDGWDIDPDTKRRISPADASLIKVLIEKGISSGILERRPGGVVEAWGTMQVGESSLVNKIDYRVPDQHRIEDHKTAKNRNYIKKTGKSLAKNLQMLVYAGFHLHESRKRGQLDPRIITIAHNQYIKDVRDAAEVRAGGPPEPQVSRVEAELTPRQIDDYWEEVILPLIAKVEHANTLDNPFDLPMPGKKSCEAFGGCPFTTLCANTEDVLTFVARINNMNGTIPDPNKPMSDAMQKFLAGRTAAVPPASTTVSVNPPALPNQAPLTTATTAPAQARLTPPWLSDKCTLCKTRPNPGFSNDGSPCRICVGASKHDISQYEWRAEPDGKLIWWKKGTTAPVAAVAPAVAAATPTKVHYTIDSLRADLAKCTTSDAVIALIDTATEALGDGSPELQVFMGMVEKTLEKLETPPAPAAGVPVAAPGMVVATPPPAPVETKSATVDPNPTVGPLPPTPPAEEAPKRRGRPPGSKGAPKEAAPDAPAPATTGGFVLMIGCAPIQGRAFAGLKTRFAEDVLSDLPGYWDGEAFARRDQVSKAAAGIAEALVGCCIVQNVPDPDTNVLIRALVPYASVVIAKSGM